MSKKLLKYLNPAKPIETFGGTGEVSDEDATAAEMLSIHNNNLDLEDDVPPVETQTAGTTPETETTPKQTAFGNYQNVGALGWRQRRLLRKQGGMYIDPKTGKATPIKAGTSRKDMRNIYTQQRDALNAARNLGTTPNYDGWDEGAKMIYEGYINNPTKAYMAYRPNPEKPETPTPEKTTPKTYGLSSAFGANMGTGEGWGQNGANTTFANGVFTALANSNNFDKTKVDTDNNGIIDENEAINWSKANNVNWGDRQGTLGWLGQQGYLGQSEMNGLYNSFGTTPTGNTATVATPAGGTATMDYNALNQQLGINADQAKYLQQIAGFTGNDVDGLLGNNSMKRLMQMGFVNQDSNGAYSLNGHFNGRGGFHTGDNVFYNNGRYANLKTDLMGNYQLDWNSDNPISYGNQTQQTPLNQQTSPESNFIVQNPGEATRGPFSHKNYAFRYNPTTQKIEMSYDKDNWETYKSRNQIGDADVATYNALLNQLKTNGITLPSQKRGGKLINKFKYNGSTN